MKHSNRELSKQEYGEAVCRLLGEHDLGSFDLPRWVCPRCGADVMAEHLSLMKAYIHGDTPILKMLMNDERK